MRQNLSVAGDLVEPCDLVDVDEMRRLGQPERHDRHQALPARQHAAVLRRDFRQNLQRLVERRGTWRMNGAGFMRQIGPACEG